MDQRSARPFGLSVGHIHQWDRGKLLCIACGALGRGGKKTGTIEALLCPCGEAATVYLGPRRYRCSRHADDTLSVEQLESPEESA